ncbi:hypothetical protein ACFQVA_17225 [Actinomadura keratinilytica]
MHLEAHGRAELFEDVDLTRTVGWFTSLHPVTLDLPAAPEDGDWRELLPAVKERLRSVPGQGVGYGALRYLRAAEPGPAGDRARALAASPTPELAFNYLGHFGTADDAAGPAPSCSTRAASTTRASGAATSWRWSAPSRTGG